MLWRLFADPHARKLGINVLSSHPERVGAAPPVAGRRQLGRRTPHIGRPL
jgi:hypothetical protein